MKVLTVTTAIVSSWRSLFNIVVKYTNKIGNSTGLTRYNSTDAVSTQIHDNGKPHAVNSAYWRHRETEQAARFRCKSFYQFIFVFRSICHRALLPICANYTGCPRMFYTIDVFSRNFGAHKNTITRFGYVD